MESREAPDALSVRRLAVQVFGDRQIAGEWMRSKIPALGGSRPGEMLDSPEGRLMAWDALERIQSGEFS